MHDGLPPSGSRPSPKSRTTELVPRVLLEQWVVVQLRLGNREQNLVCPCRPCYPRPRSGRECSRPDQILAALAFRGELEEPLLQKRGAERRLVGGDDRVRSATS